MELAELRTVFAKTLRVPESDVFMTFSKEHPKCLCVAILRDVGPRRTMEGLMALKPFKVKRAVVNVVEKKYAARVRGAGSIEAILKESWNVNVATIDWTG